MASDIRSVGSAAGHASLAQNRMTDVTQILCPFCLKANVPYAQFCQHCGRDVVLNNDAPRDDPRRYRITRVIKKGGQGAVYEGVDQEGRVYAIKMMLDRFDDPREQAEAIARFNAEAEVLQRLSHPAIPRIYSHFTDEGRHYLTMDFVQGEDLEQIVEREGRIPEERVLDWADQIADVLEYLHARGLIYRDMKPSNVMIQPDGRVKVVDFGIAKLFKPAERGTQIGTPGYAPPEQYQGLATPQSDVYALAATLHHLLTGRDPTQEKPFSFPPVRDLVPTISQRTNDALVRALQFKVDDRFATIAEFREALRLRPSAEAARVRVAPPTGQMGQLAASVSAPPRASQPVTPSPPPRPASVGEAASSAVAPSAKPRRTAPLVSPSPASRPSGSAASPPVPPSPLPSARSRPGPQPRPGAGPARLISQVLVVAFVAVIGLAAYVYVARPDWAAPYIGLIGGGGAAPTSTDAPGAWKSIEKTYDLEVTVPENADATAVREQFVQEFEKRARSEHPEAQINLAARPSYIGEPQEVGRANGQVTYRAQMKGRVYVPNQ